MALFMVVKNAEWLSLTRNSTKGCGRTVAKLYKSFAWMQMRYVHQRKTEIEIAKELGVDQSIINRWLHKHGLKRPR